MDLTTLARWFTLRKFGFSTETEFARTPLDIIGPPAHRSPDAEPAAYRRYDRKAETVARHDRVFETLGVTVIGKERGRSRRSSTSSRR